MARKKVMEDISTAPIEESDGVLVSAITPTEPPPPTPNDPGWTDYIISQMEGNETDGEGHPRRDGLRRMVEKHMGKIIRSQPVQVVPPKGSGDSHMATVVWEVVYRDFDGDMCQWGDVADVYPGNTEPEFARFASSTAGTRAEARTYRKILRLSRVAADELTKVDVADAGLNGLITPQQTKVMDKLCRDLDIDIMKYVNAGKIKYKHVTHVTYEKAIDTLEYLNTLFQNPDTIPESLKGYDPNWREAK
jgi:hypothetical protein